MRIIVTGGAGFMGSNFVRKLVALKHEVLVYDKLTYSGRLENLKDVWGKIVFVQGDICNEELLRYIIKEWGPDLIVNFAAETHVDRSINEPAPFIRTNILGVFSLLEVVRKTDIRLIHISTDEVYGDLEPDFSASEDSILNPSSPYSASKASADLMIKAYYRTYGINVTIVRPSNNYGPYQFPEKFIPKIIIRAVNNKPIPVYGDGSQIRDWLYVEDFCNALLTVIERGSEGEIYNIPGFNEKRNIDVVKDILKLLKKPESLIKFVEDRPGHDRRYSMKGDKIKALGWKPKVTWLEGLKRTINWYLSNEWWWRPLLGDDYFRKDIPWR